MKPISILLALLLLFSAALPVSALTIIDAMDGEPEMTPMLDFNGEPMLGSDGEVLLEQVYVQATDEDGLPLFDEMGNPVMMPSYICTWEGAMLDESEMAEGSACITASTDGGEVTFIFRPEEETAPDFSSYLPNIAFDLWIYADVPERLTSATLTIEDIDGAETVWDLKTTFTRRGWNHVTCTIDAAVMDHADFSAFGAVILSFTSNGPNTLKADLLRVGEKREFGIGSVQIDANSSTYRVLENFDGGTVRILDGLYDSKNMMEGDACLSSLPGMGVAAASVQFLSPIDLSRYLENGYLYFWLWVEDVNKVGEGKILLASSGSPDFEACGFLLDDIELRNGWNELLLPLSLLKQKLGNDRALCDLTKVDCFAVYSLREEVLLLVDALRIGLESDLVGEPSIPLPLPPATDPPVIEPPVSTPTESDPPVSTPPATDPIEPNPTESGSNEETQSGNQATEEASGSSSDTEKTPSSDSIRQLQIIALVFVLLLLVVLIAAMIDKNNNRGSKGKKKKKSKKSKSSSKGRYQKRR